MSDAVAPVVELSGVTREFGDVTAVNELTCEVTEGGVLGLLGDNGAGKTTTLRLISGVLNVTHGSVRVFGVDPVVDGASVRRRTGVLVARPQLDVRMTGRENLEFIARLYGLDSTHAADRIAELVTSFNLDDRLDDRVAHYSAGMAQRLALARLLLPDPSLLLLDEPTATLDPMAAHSVRALIGDLARSESRTIIVSTHDLIEAAQVCDRVAVLQRGALVALGTPAELAARVDARSLRLRVADADRERATAVAAERAYPTEPLADGALRLHGVNYDDVPDLVRALVTNGIDVYGATIDEPTLTDFYLALHSDEPEPSDGDVDVADRDRASR